jgi:N-ethylmaleimide reductase
MPTLFDPIHLGEIALANRIVMAPLTRNRATPGENAPHALNVEYYRQRATAGLIIAEATQISPEGKGYALTPGIYSDAQTEGWKRVTQAVHRAGGRIVLQLWHVGRISHTSLQPGGAAPVSASAVRAENTKTFIENPPSFVDTSVPRALETHEMPGLIEAYRQAGANAKAAGFDGIEVHAANGYLLQQFLSDATNQRTDEYGGPIANRARLILEVVEALTSEWGGGRVGIRLSPWTKFGEALDSNPEKTFGYVIRSLNRFGLAYLHMVEGDTGGKRASDGQIAAMRDLFEGAYIANNGYDGALAEARIATGQADAVAFGRPFIANPDLVERLRTHAPLNEGNQATYYGGGAEGYTDYPFLDQAKAA